MIPRNRVPPGMFNPGDGTPIIPRPNVSQDYVGAEFIEKLYSLPQIPGETTEVFSTNNAHSALNLYFDPRFGLENAPDPTVSTEYIFTIYAISGQIVEQCAQGRFTNDPNTNIFSDTGALICSVSSEAQRFKVTCTCLTNPAVQSGQTVGISAFAYSTEPSYDPVMNGAPSGVVVNRAFATPTNQGVFSTTAPFAGNAPVSLFEFYGYNNSGHTVFIRVMDSQDVTNTTRVLFELLVPDQNDFSKSFSPPLWCSEGLSWRASLSPLGALDAGAAVAAYAQYR